MGERLFVDLGREHALVSLAACELMEPPTTRLRFIGVKVDTARLLMRAVSAHADPVRLEPPVGTRRPVLDCSLELEDADDGTEAEWFDQQALCPRPSFSPPLS